MFDIGILTKGFYSEIRQKGVQQDLNDIAEITYGFVGADMLHFAENQQWSY